MAIPLEQRRIAADEVRLPAGVPLEGTKGRILQEALRLFAERGFHGTSIRDLADACGIRSATLYAHYPTKEHVLAELIRIGHEDHRDRLLRAEGADPVSRLRAVVRAHVLAHAEHPLLAVVATNELHALSPEMAAPALLIRADARQLMYDILDEGLAQGLFEMPDTFLVLNAISGMGIRVANWYGTGVPYTPQEIADAYADLALRVVGAAR
ncbi:TetR family transcriptional regulator [Sphaerisporangium siamense]|uniref:AcrR family transcriptional regulator n=1 Tax=Sphaerisporangium siamense TaxID=795645 RepID=A0A7W7D1U2_9ACTN|nr:TetR/AcrR family transcriptional regulator [Sphaerisporangium siamense]MBB4698760.1 AcrR family transcriptional regulator [Sphaerisporangium siamense]GII85178.1 TetR family transcriptional regulator [Sphaerisporangium siamense]